MTAKKKTAKKLTRNQLEQQLEDARALLFDFVKAVEYDAIQGVRVDEVGNHFVRIGQAEWYDAGDIYMEVCKFFGRKPKLPPTPPREFTFDVKLFAEVSVRAHDEESASQIIKDAIDGTSANLGSWPNGDPIVTDVSIDGEPDFVEEDETEEK